MRAFGDGATVEIKPGKGKSQGFLGKLLRAAPLQLVEFPEIWGQIAEGRHSNSCLNMLKLGCLNMLKLGRPHLLPPFEPNIRFLL